MRYCPRGRTAPRHDASPRYPCRATRIAGATPNHGRVFPIYAFGLIIIVRRSGNFSFFPHSSRVENCVIAIKRSTASAGKQKIARSRKAQAGNELLLESWTLRRQCPPVFTTRRRRALVRRRNGHSRTHCPARRMTPANAPTACVGGIDDVRHRRRPPDAAS